MTPQEKAQELVDKYSMITKWKMGVEQEYVIKRAKECAIIAVDELIRVTPWGGNIDNEIEDDSKEFYMKVKQEIENN